MLLIVVFTLPAPCAPDLGDTPPMCFLASCKAVEYLCQALAVLLTDARILFIALVMFGAFNTKESCALSTRSI